MANVTLYQSKGKIHIRYINKLARNIWRDYEFKNSEWKNCIKRALKKHVTYLKSLNEIEMPESSEINTSGGSWYKNDKGIWIKL